MKQTWQAPQLQRIGNLAQLVAATHKVSGTQDSGGGNPLHTHKNA